MEVFDTIEEETEFTFAFNYDQLNLDKIVSVEAQSQSVDEILHQVFRNTNITWGLSGNVVLLKGWEEPEDRIENEPDFFQETITGRVTDAQNGEALPGVDIVVDGTTSGSTADVNGGFDCKVT